ncbi:hypothetical protein FRC02_004993 [Tulasnella sp. 418]|nr:hypothetical protein FRC02_004993 [Tulasnella sp. 418]
MRGSQYPCPDLVQWSQPPLAPLTPLELSAGRDAFLRISPNSASDSQLDTLLKELDCMPLAVTLMARLAFDGETPSDLLYQWKEERTALLDQSGGDRGNSIEVSIKLSIMSNSVKNCPGGIAFLSILAKLPAGSPLSHIPDICPSISSWRNVIRILKRVALIHESADKSFLHMLSPVRSYVLLHHPLETKLLQDLQSAYFKTAFKGDSNPGQDSFLTNRKEISGIAANMEVILLEALHSTVEDKDAALLASIHYSVYLYWIHSRTEIIEAAAQVAKAAKSNLYAECLWRYGTNLLRIDQYDQAELVLTQAKPEFDAIGNRHGAAQCLRILGEILRMKNQYDEAEVKLKQAKPQFDELGDHFSSAQCLRSLGDVFMMKNLYTQAERTHKEAIAKFESVGGHRGIAQCLRAFGEILQVKGQYDQAETSLTKAQSLFEEIGDPLDAAKCLRILGDNFRMKNEYDQGEMTIRQAKSCFDDAVDHLGIARCLHSLGHILGMKNRYEEAEMSLKQAKSVFHAIGHPLGVAQCLRSLGDILRMKNQYDQAELMFKQAKSEFDIVQSPFGAAQCLRSLGDIFLQRGHSNEAQPVLEEAKSLLLSSETPLDTAYCCISLATVLQLRGSHEAALNELGEARAIFKSLDQTEWVEKCDREIDFIHSSRND